MVYWEAVICFEKYSMHDNDTMHDNCFETVQSSHQHYKYTITTTIHIIFIMTMTMIIPSILIIFVEFGVNLQLIWFFVLRIDFRSYFGQQQTFEPPLFLSSSSSSYNCGKLG